ncbi:MULTISPECIES: hypothetical protein [unclassified Gordonia (in: high G+C Gram-positive bacteria)]|uniref:hypothetical protein n=1 Tax=unclassified Gordonia (in: high G+C Gram-positive bacteria) TaxID=2657482 RepID=UPI0007EB290D|nr:MULTISPECIES: hypothetical protein [unclassified Gordonia (in: high G+C Gram-positive bacteria)]OBC00887.1 hypothetical protein A5785_18145 [Gordonia sp. 852002-50395_SCH5434458]OBC10492.1 hypothetical protein A5786_01400 [Gordonia sp. 852002-50816_SCH5313054-a]OBC17962.1 hypothetical protein A5788_11450 [Gordonia sp. 852002-50816_SCH5313054-c]
MMNAAVRPRASMMALAGFSVASAAVIGAVPSMSQAATYAAAMPTAVTQDAAVAAAAALATPLAGTPSAATPSAGTPSATDTDPLAIYQQVLTKAQAAIEKLKKTASKTEYPILNQLLANQTALVNGIINGAVAGEWKEGKAADFSPIWTQIQAALDGLDSAGIEANVTAALSDQLPKLLEAVSTSLSSGDIEGAMNNLLLAVVTPVYSVIKPTKAGGGVVPTLVKLLNVPLNAGLIAAGAIPNADIAAAISTPISNAIKVNNVIGSDFAYIGMGIISPVAGGIGGFGRGVQNVIDALGTNDLEGALTALVQAPAITLDGFLHGGYGPSVGGLVGFNGVRVVSGGLLGGVLQLSGTDADGTPAIVLPGTGWVLQRVQEDIRKAITPKPPKKTVSADMATLVAAQTDSTVTASDAAATASDAAASDAAAPTATVADSTEAPAQSSGDKSGSVESSGTADVSESATDSTSSSAGSSSTGSSSAGSKGTGSAADADTDADAADTTESADSATSKSESASAGSSASSES